MSSNGRSMVVRGRSPSHKIQTDVSSKSDLPKTGTKITHNPLAPGAMLYLPTLPPAPGAMLLQGSLLHGSRYAPHIQLCTGGAGVGNSLLSRSVRGNTRADPYLSHFIRVFVCNCYHGSFYATLHRGRGGNTFSYVLPCPFYQRPRCHGASQVREEP